MGGISQKCAVCHEIVSPDDAACPGCGAPLAPAPLAPEQPGSAASTLTWVIPEVLLAPGRVFAGRYQVREKLGRGGMGEVYRAHDITIDEDVALKFINPEIAASPRIVERFRNELKTARRISHRNVCRMFDIHQSEGLLYISMEYVPGEDLHRLLRRAGTISVDDGLRIAAQVCSGLAEAHRLGVIHRDLKPGNIILGSDGQAKVMDFGLALSSGDTRITHSGTVVGTPVYMSPEQLEGARTDARSDIYALGVILFEMLTGRPPFTADSALALALKHRTEPPPRPDEVNPDIPGDIAELILRCLEKDPEDRFPCIEDVEAAIVGADLSPCARKKRRRHEGRGRRFRKWAPVAALALAALAFGARQAALSLRARGEENGAIVDIGRHAREGDFVSAWMLARQAGLMETDHPSLASLMAEGLRTAEIQTYPPDADVSIRPAGAPDETWQAVGRTPLQAELPRGELEIRIRKNGFGEIRTSDLAWDGRSEFLLESDETAPGPTRTPDGLLPVIEIRRIEDTEAFRIDGGTAPPEPGSKGTVHEEPGAPAVASCVVTEAAPDGVWLSAVDPQRPVRLGDGVRFGPAESAAVSGAPVPITFETTPSDATVSVDGRVIRSRSLELTPGRHSILVRKDGYRDLSDRLEIRNGDKALVKRYALERSVTPGKVVIGSDPPGARIFLKDGESPAGATPFEAELPPQELPIRVSMEGYEDRAEVIAVKSGETASRFFSLQGKPGEVEVDSEPPGADVFVDSGRTPAGRTPLRLTLPAGSHHLRLAISGRPDKAVSIVIPPGGTARPVMARIEGAPEKTATIASDPSGAAVYVNDEIQPGATPLQIRGPAGRVNVRIEKEGFLPVDGTVELGTGAEIRNFVLERRGEATLILTASPVARVEVDGNLLEEAIPPRKTLTTWEGEHVVRFLFENDIRLEEKVHLAKGEQRPLHGNLESMPELGIYDFGAFPWANLKVNDRDFGRIPPMKPMHFLEGDNRILLTFDPALRGCRQLEIRDELRRGRIRRIHVSTQTDAGEPGERVGGGMADDTSDEAAEEVDWMEVHASFPIPIGVDGAAPAAVEGRRILAKSDARRLRLDLPGGATGRFQIRIFDSERGRAMSIVLNVSDREMK